MGVMGVFKWLRKDIKYRDKNGRSLSAKQCAFSNDSYRNARQAFIDHRRSSTAILETTSRENIDVKSVSLFPDGNNDKDKKNDIKADIIWIGQKNDFILLDVPYIPASKIFEIGWIAGTEDRYLELVYAEWENTRISLKRHTHPDCRNANKADIEVLTKIRHPNVLMLMAMTQTEDHGLVSILEPVDSTLYNYIHEQGKRISVQQIARFAGKLADALRHAHMRGYVHSAISSHCVYLASGKNVKLGGWELSASMRNPKPKREYEERLRTEIFRWQAPELFSGKSYTKSDVYGLTLLIWEMSTGKIPWSNYSMSDLEKQYTQVRRGLPFNLSNFPPLINNLLKNGLQLDVEKRNPNMNRICGLLQNLEMQYECKEPMYVDELTSNNCYPVLTGTNHRNVGSQTDGLAAPLFYPKSDTTSISEVVSIARSTSISDITYNYRSNLCDNSKEERSYSVDKQRSKPRVPNSVQKRSYKLTSESSELSSSAIKNSNNMKRHIPWNCTYRKEKSPQNLSVSDYGVIASYAASPSCDNFNNTEISVQSNESIFEKIYNLTSRDGADEIRNIEKADNTNEVLLFNKKLTTDTETFGSNTGCNSKTESNESTFSTECTKQIARISAVNTFSETYDQRHNLESNVSFLLSRDKTCKTCSNKVTLPRRRSLPIALCHLKVGNNSTLGRLPIRKAINNTDHSIEDFYIDDDDLDVMNLNINMVLSNEEVKLDDLLFEEQTIWNFTGSDCSSIPCIQFIES